MQIARPKIASVACAAVMLALAALLAAAPAGAARAPSRLTVLYVGSGGEIDASAVIGFVTSPNRRCLSDRRIVVTLTKPAGEVRLDVARSGANGGWFARGPQELLNGATAIRVDLIKRRIGRGPGALRCRGATLEPT